jgi:hypothetical protein
LNEPSEIASRARSHLMAKTSSSVRIKVVRADSSERDGASRETFWRPLRDSTEKSNEFAVESEGRFRREFGNHLRDSLVEMFDSAMRNSDFQNFERFWMHWGPSERSQHFADGISRWAEARQQEFAESPALRAARENRVLARQVCFTVSRISYSSLLFDLDFGPIEKVAAIFDSNFDSFQVFLNAFVPVAFAQSTTDSFANLHTYEIDPGDEVRRAFVAPAPIASLHSQPSGETRSTAQGSREKAEWLWKLANGSLLIPVLLGLIVMLYAVRELAAINRYQQEQMKPILEHHLELLKEDRLRLQEQREGKAEQKPSPTPAKPADPSPSHTP